VRLGTVSDRWREGRRLPDLRLTGRWLEDAGFDRGREYEVAVEAGRPGGCPLQRDIRRDKSFLFR
jgi:hypothetical protein